MQRRLRAIGLRPINALVDITNYLTFDRGRPLHVFDAGKVNGRSRRAPRAARARACSRSTARPIRSTRANVVIADDNGVESIAGIMGGEASGCDETTTDVLIESALWDPTNIAQHRPQARHRHRCALSLRARRRSGLLRARRRAGDALVWSSAAASPRSSSWRAIPRRRAQRVPFPYSEVKRLTGLDLPRGRRRGDPRAARLRASTDGAGDRAELAARHRRQGRSRRGDRAHRRPRPRRRRRRCRGSAPACRRRC